MLESYPCVLRCTLCLLDQRRANSASVRNPDVNQVSEQAFSKEGHFRWDFSACCHNLRPRAGEMGHDSGLALRWPVFVSVKIDRSKCEIELSYRRASE